MRSFQSFQSGGEKRTENGKTAPENNTGAEDLVRKIASAWQGKSKGEMLKEVLKEAEERKRMGTLTNAEIDAFYMQFAPMLDSAQKQKLQAVVDRLKKI